MIQKISVLGAGTMGHGIAAVFALHGYDVSLYEAYESVRETAVGRIKEKLTFMGEEGYVTQGDIDLALGRISIYSDLAEAVREADYVVEATPENMELKQNLFRELDDLCPQHTILASNTSSLPLNEMTKLISEVRKAKTMVCHWYNPAHLIPIAELSFFGNMSEEDFGQVYDLHVKAGKQPVKVLKDIPGLIANRMLHALAREVFSLMESGAASPEDIDKALKFGPGFRSATTGMLEVSDMGGLDVWCTVQDNLLSALNKDDKACNMLRAKVAEGKLGMKTGEGFFNYDDEEKKEAAQKAFQKRLLAQLKVSQTY